MRNVTFTGWFFENVFKIDSLAPILRLSSWLFLETRLSTKVLQGSLSSAKILILSVWHRLFKGGIILSTG